MIFDQKLITSPNKSADLTLRPFYKPLTVRTSCGSFPRALKKVAKCLLMSLKQGKCNISIEVWEILHSLPLSNSRPFGINVFENVKRIKCQDVGCRLRDNHNDTEHHKRYRALSRSGLRSRSSKRVSKANQLLRGRKTGDKEIDRYV